MKYLLLLTFVLTGCATTNADKQLKRRDVEQYFSGTGVVKYFLSDLPEWANFSQTASCKRSTSVRYFNMSSLKKSYNYNYEQSVQLQYMYNVELNRLKSKTENSFIPFSEEEKMFFTLTDKVQANIRTFRVPTFKRVNLVWIDPFLKTRGGEKRLVQLLNSKAMDTGHPVLISMCLNHLELETYLGRRGLLNKNIRYIPYEMFSPYNSEGEMEYLFQINFKEIFSSKQKLYLYIPPNKMRPREFIGKLRIKTF